MNAKTQEKKQNMLRIPERRKRGACYSGLCGGNIVGVVGCGSTTPLKPRVGFVGCGSRPAPEAGGAVCFVMRACVGVHFLFSFSGILCVCHSYIIELCRWRLVWASEQRGVW
jgi:hypothetical protein